MPFRMLDISNLQMLAPMYMVWCQIKTVGVTILLFYLQIYVYNHRFGWLDRIIKIRTGSQENEFMVSYVEFCALITKPESLHS